MTFVTGIDPSQCPLCGATNECGMVAGVHECWCFNARVAPAILAQLPPEAEGVACVCQACASGKEEAGDPRGAATKNEVKALVTDGGARIDEYTLRLDGIRFLAHLGASQSERGAEQEVVVDVELTLPVSSLPAQDRIQDVVDYDSVARAVVEEGVERPHRLLETYIARVVKRLLADTPATRVRVAATKRHVPTKVSVDAAIVALIGSRRIP